MKIYLVGGAVRDLLLNQPINEYDWVVVGSTPEQMLSNGYQQVGKDFPVFLHPHSKEEYALARTERKSSHGYTGFEVFADSSVTLESDLLRRDLTINALALDIEKLCGHYIKHHQHKNPLQHLLSTQNKLSLSEFSSSEIIAAIIDPFDGLNDLSSRKLKHISPAFSEDPLRVIRLARFSARFFHLGFSIVEETAYLAKKMSDSGELDYLVAERVWQETERALMTQTPSQYFEFLYNVRALEKIYPELAEQFKLDADLEFTANHSTPRHIPIAQRFAGLNILAKQNYPNQAKLALLFTALLDRNRKKPEFVQLCQTWKIPNSYRDLAWSIHDRINHWLSLQKMDASLLLNFLTDLNVFKQNETLEVYCAICFAVFHSADYAEANLKQKIWLIHAVNIVREITAQEFINQGKVGAEIKDSLVLARKTALEHYLSI